MSRVRKSITISNFLAKDIENAVFIDKETDFSNRVEYLCRSAILLNNYGRREVICSFEENELLFIYQCLRGFVATSQVNPTLEVHSLVCQYNAMSNLDQVFAVDAAQISERLLKLSEVASFALIGMSQQYWNEKEEELIECTSLTENN